MPEPGSSSHSVPEDVWGFDEQLGAEEARCDGVSPVRWAHRFPSPKDFTQNYENSKA